MKDCYCVLEDKKYFKIVRAGIINTREILIGHSYTRLENYFESPFDSSRLGIVVASEPSEIQQVSILSVACKLVGFPQFDGKILFLPIVHTT